jgi:hypothetical protein
MMASRLSFLPGHAVCGLSGPCIPLLAVHRDLTKISYRLFPPWFNRKVWQGTGALQGIIISQVQAKKVEDLGYTSPNPKTHEVFFNLLSCGLDYATTPRIR